MSATTTTPCTDQVWREGGYADCGRPAKRDGRCGNHALRHDKAQFEANRQAVRERQTRVVSAAVSDIYEKTGVRTELVYDRYNNAPYLAVAPGRSVVALLDALGISTDGISAILSGEPA